MMHKSQLQKMYPYDWFCAPGSHLRITLILVADISGWTLTGLKQLRFTWFSINLIYLFFKSVSLKSDFFWCLYSMLISQSSLDCIALYVLIIKQSIILLRHITGRYRVPNDNYMHFVLAFHAVCYTIKISLIFWSYKYQHLHQIVYFSQFESEWNWVFFSSSFSLYQTIWAIKASNCHNTLGARNEEARSFFKN